MIIETDILTQLSTPGDEGAAEECYDDDHGKLKKSRPQRSGIK